MRTALSTSFIAALAACFIGTPVLASSTCTVSSGDSLWAIARREHTTVAALERANGLTDASVLQLGQQLIVPSTGAVGFSRPSSRAYKSFGRLKSTAPGKFGRLKSTAPITIAAATDIDVSRALWAATHGGETPLSLPGMMPYGAIAKAIAFEGRITATAMRYLGVPYAWGGTSFDGMDCSGFVWTVFHRNGIDLPRAADDQFAAIRHIRWRAMRPGDLVFFETYTSGVSHVGIYLGRGRFIHASSSNGVRIDSLGADYYASRFVGAGRAAR